MSELLWLQISTEAAPSFRGIWMDKRGAAIMLVCLAFTMGGDDLRDEPYSVGGVRQNREVKGKEANQVTMMHFGFSLW
jgi:hypothetical protein